MRVDVMMKDVFNCSPTGLLHYVFETTSAFLANVNYAIARPSVVCHMSVCLSVVCNVRRPTEAVQIFGNISTALGTLAIH